MFELKFDVLGILNSPSQFLFSVEVKTHFLARNPSSLFDLRFRSPSKVEVDKRSRSPSTIVRRRGRCRSVDSRTEAVELVEDRLEESLVLRNFIMAS